VIQRTFGIIKPDAVAAGYTGEIISRIEKEGFSIIGMEKRSLSLELVRTFYAIHKERSFFDEIVTFITSGPVVTLALEKEDAISAWRNLMGATDPTQAASDTLRKLYGAHIGNNAVHGSDGKETARFELNLFFPHLS